MTTAKKILFLSINFFLSSGLINFILLFFCAVTIYAVFNFLGINSNIHPEQIFFLDEGIKNAVVYEIILLPVFLIFKFSILPIFYKMKIFYSFLNEIVSKNFVKILTCAFAFDILTNLLSAKLYCGNEFTLRTFFDFYLFALGGVLPCYIIFFVWHGIFIKNKSDV